MSSSNKPRSARPEGRSHKQGSIQLVALASLIGTTIEWYDFFLYGTAAALVLNKLFFPTFNPLNGTLAALGTYAVGFVARPIGGIVIGHYGDRVGRKSMLVLTLVLMGLATFCIGLLPTYATIGPLAPVLLVLLRSAQGFGVGGEWGGAVLMAVEHAPPGRRGFYGSWPHMGVPIGLLLANGAFAASSKMSEGRFLAWGWRVPFLLSLVLVAIGLFIRLRLVESPAFQRMQADKREAALPFAETWRTHSRSVFLAIGASIGEKAAFYVYTVFLLTYGTKTLGLSRGVLLGGVLIAAACMIVAVPVAGAISDRVGRRPVYVFGAAVTIVFAYPLYQLIDTRSTSLVWLALTIALVFAHTPMYAPQTSFMSELFPTRLRYTGVSLGYQIAGAIGGGLSPFIATALMPHGRLALASQLAAGGALTIIVMSLVTETAKRPLAE